MKKLFSTILIALGFAVSAANAAEWSAVAESFDRDMNRNVTVAQAVVDGGQDSFQQYVNRALTGSDAIYASFNNDLNRAFAPAPHIAIRSDSILQQINITLRYQSNPILASFEHNLGVILLATTIPQQAANKVDRHVHQGAVPLIMFA